MGGLIEKWNYYKKFQACQFYENILISMNFLSSDISSDSAQNILQFWYKVITQ